MPRVSLCVQPHIPYRNHKLTMLMSDSLGGTAKTLMFVNVSPTDSNLDETQTSLQVCTRECCCARCLSCEDGIWSFMCFHARKRMLPVQYATRVRTIKNDVSRNEVSKDVIRLRQQVSALACMQSDTVTSGHSFSWGMEAMKGIDTHSN